MTTDPPPDVGTLTIRRAQAADAQQMLAIFRAVTEPGDTYVFGEETSEEDALRYWFGPGIVCHVAAFDAEVAGMYKLIPNYPGRGSHVANASFMVDPSRRGQGIGRRLALHCLREARSAGYSGMQFNFVVSTNLPAVKLWQDLGFAVVGTLPKVFNHRELGLVDAFVMYRSLTDIPSDSRG